MPSPQILHGYQALVPDAPERILKQYELDAAHLREVSILALRSEIGDTRRAQWIACGLVVFGLAIATWLAFSKHTEVAVAIVVTLLVTVVINFLNSYKQEQPQEEKTTTPAKSRKKSKEK